MGHDYGRDGFPSSTITVDTPPGDVGGVQPPDLGGPGEFSFERDVQPLTKRYFRAAFGSGVDPVKAAEIYQRAAQGAKQSYVQNTQIRGLDEQSRNRRVDYEKSVFALASARDTARRERENMTRLLPLQDTLTGILNDPNKDNNTRRLEIGVLAVRHGTDPAALKVLDAARYGAEQRESSKLTAGKFVELGGSAGQLKEYQDRLGRPLGLDEELPDAVGWLSKIDQRKDSLAKDKAKEAAEKKERETFEVNADKALQFAPKWKPHESGTGLSGDLLRPEDEEVLDGVLLMFAAPEELLKANSPAAKYALIERIRRERLLNPGSRPVNIPAARRSTRDTIRGGMLGPPK